MFATFNVKRTKKQFQTNIGFSVLLPALLAANIRASQTNIIIDDFEGDAYGTNWTVTGSAFGPGPVHRALPGQLPVTGFLGNGFATSFHGGDQSVGALTSTPFRIERKYIQFLLGGGWYYGKTCVNLLLNGHVVRTAVGSGDKEDLAWCQWDVSDLMGEEAVIEILDRENRRFGHINVDQIVQSNERLPGLLSDVTRALTVNRRYLNLPIKNGAPKRSVQFIVDGKIAREFDIELADSNADWWAFLDLTSFKGKRATLKVNQLTEGSSGISSIEQSDEIKGAQPLYQETLRPQFHFSSRRGWINDPNGLVFFKGEYHLFYQHNPYGWKWGNKHWGHAVSRDLVHWQELGEALYPDEHGFTISGSAVVDSNNTSGFADGDNIAMVCFYTGAGSFNRQSQGQPFTQRLAYSLDCGRSWVKHGGNPVVPHIIAENRDPKVFWFKPDKKWIMALYLDMSNFTLLSSTNLKKWNRLSDVTIPGVRECPELFEIPIDGNNHNTRWIFYGGSGGYLVGQFNGKNFTPESGPHQLNFGNCFYASQTFNNIPPEDGRRILIGWGTIAFPDMPFNQMMDFPVEITLHNTDDGLRLFATPVKEIESLYAQSYKLESQLLKPGENPLKFIRGDLFDIKTEIALGTTTQIIFNIRGVPVLYDVIKAQLSCEGKTAVLKAENGKIRLRFLVDRTSVEIFGNDGALYMPMGMIIPVGNQSLGILTKDGEAQIIHLDVHQLTTAWPIGRSK